MRTTDRASRLCCGRRRLDAVTIRLGYQIPNFSYGTGPQQIFPTVLRQAREAEQSGFDTVLLMDHFYQLPGIGDAQEPMLECYTTLGALATGTERVGLSALVTGNTYRNPTLLAKAVTALDVVSGGRAILGIGAGWFELEHDQLGYEFGTFTDRFARLDEALQIIEPMLRGKRASLEGTWYRADQAMNEPRVRDSLPIMIGGSGEKKTFGLAARYADHLNLICNDTEIPRKLDALAHRCAEIGRDRATIEVSYLASVFIDEDGDAARRQQRDHLASRGVHLDEMSDEERAGATARQFVGDPDDGAEQVQRRIIDRGVESFICNMITNGHVEGMVALAGRTLAPLITG